MPTDIIILQLPNDRVREIALIPCRISTTQGFSRWRARSSLPWPGVGVEKRCTPS